MNRLWVKLTLAFLAIALVAVGVVAVVIAQTTGAESRQYVVSSTMAAQSGWADALWACADPAAAIGALEATAVSTTSSIGIS